MVSESTILPSQKRHTKASLLKISLKVKENLPLKMADSTVEILKVAKKMDKVRWSRLTATNT